MSLSIAPEPYQASAHDQFEVEAEGLGRYVIDVSLPANLQPDATYPVILVTDGNLLFDIAQTICHGRTQQRGSFLPPAILVETTVDQPAPTFQAADRIG